MRDLLIPYVHFLTSSRFPVAEAFSQCAEPKVLVLSHGVNNANPSFCAGKKIRKGEAFSWFPNLLLLKAALSRLDFGPAYYEDPVSRTSSFSLLGSRGSYAAAFPGPFLFLVLRPEAIA